MKDPNELPYAEWLENSLRSLSEMDAECIAMAAIDSGGDVFTAYYSATMQDKLIMAGNIHMDAVFDMARANAGAIVEAAEGEEDGT